MTYRAPSPPGKRAPVQSQSVLPADAAPLPEAAKSPLKRSPITWVPTLYFAQGVPFFVVMAIAALLFKDLGIENSVITKWTNALGLA